MTRVARGEAHRSKETAMAVWRPETKFAFFGCSRRERVGEGNGEVAGLLIALEGGWSCWGAMMA